jgi:hydroxymethylbilane synthase
VLDDAGHPGVHHRRTRGPGHAWRPAAPRPLGALAEVVEGEHGDELWIRAVALSPDGALSVRHSASGPLGDAAGVGTRLAELMLDEGAADLMETTARKPHA